MSTESKGIAPQQQVTSSEGSLLDRIIQDGKLAQTKEEHDQAKLWLESLVQSVVDRNIIFKKDVEVALNERILAIDEAISKQLNEVMHAKQFQKMEATWRGLHYLLSKTET